MKYEEMSDFDINKRVFPHTIDYGKCEDVMAQKNQSRGALMWGDGANWFEFDPCNNPSDAWPIIVENKIETGWFCGDKWLAVIDNQFEAGEFKRVAACHENPLRAAMIVFLKMQDGES